MRFPSFSRREEPAATTAGEDADRNGAVATDTRTTTTRPTVEERDDSRTTYRSGTAARATATDRVAGRDGTGIAGRDRTDEVAGRDRADRVAGEDRAATEQTAEQPTGERAAAARAATARSSVGGSRRARTAAPVGTPDADRTADLDRPADPTRTTDRDGTVEQSRTVAPARTTDQDGTVEQSRTVAPARTTDQDGTVEQSRTVDGERTVDRDRGPAPDAPPAPAGPRPRASLLATLGLIGAVAGLGFVLTGILAGYGIALGALGAVLAVLGLIATRRRHIAGKSDALLGIVLGLGAVVVGVLAMTGQYDWPTTDGDTVARFREWLDSQFVDRF
ncbi:thrombospondin [Micromonospora sp. FIMYZ51]|uniref:thrombospondin n=1 Tax=Micromonospora sp. FIMYZ51 TaxID=3051832 RepID=UPI00311DE32F